MAFQKLTDEQWERVKTLLTTEQAGITEKRKKGHPGADSRLVLNGILYVLLTGSAWGKIPKTYGTSVTCWRRFKKWSEDGTWARVWPELLATFDDVTKQQWAEALLNGYFQPCKLGERPAQSQDEHPPLHKKHKTKKT